MKTFLFIGANSDVAIEAKKQLKKVGNKVICISRSSSEALDNALIGNPVSNELPELMEIGEKIIKKIDSLEYKIDILQKNIMSIDKKIDVHLETVNTPTNSPTNYNTSSHNSIKFQIKKAIKKLTALVLFLI